FARRSDVLSSQGLRSLNPVLAGLIAYTLYYAIKKLVQGEPKVIGTSLYIGANLLAPDVVEHNDFLEAAPSRSYREISTGSNSPKNFWNVAFSSFSTLTNYTLPAIFRPAPDNTITYSPYVSPETVELINQYTIPTIEAVLQELITLGKEAAEIILRLMLTLIVAEL
ncbi:hypothetical protein MPER_06884, partial [Moniliophthora perniciosa FA553]